MHTYILRYTCSHIHITNMTYLCKHMNTCVHIKHIHMHRYTHQGQKDISWATV